MNTKYIKASVNNTTIYIKLNGSIIEGLFDVLHDNNYKIEASTENEWGNNLEYGNSYEIETDEELEDFKEINNKAKQLRNETQS